MLFDIHTLPLWIQLSLIAFNGLMWRIRGGGVLSQEFKDSLPLKTRIIWIIYSVLLYACFIPEWWKAGLYAGIQILMGIYATHGLFTAGHDMQPGRSNIFIATLEKWKFPHGRIYGVMYGVLRGLAVMPLVLVLRYYEPNISMLLPVVILMQGFFYILRPVQAEVIIGALLMVAVLMEGFV